MCLPCRHAGLVAPASRGHSDVLPYRPAGAMDEASMLEELSIILCFLNPFLARMPEDARTQLCSFLKMETLARDTVLWSQGEDISKFYLILSGEHAALSSASGALCALREGVAPKLMQTKLL